MTEVFKIASLNKMSTLDIYIHQICVFCYFFIYQVEVHDVGKEMELDLIKQYSQVFPLSPTLDYYVRFLLLLYFVPFLKYQSPGWKDICW
jgi:hypothetical protein